MHEHITIFWTIVLGIIGSIMGGGRYPHVFAPGKRTDIIPPAHFFHIGRDLDFSFICFKLKIIFQRRNPIGRSRVLVRWPIFQVK